MNLLRRLQVVAGVVVACAALGAVSGVLVASALLLFGIGDIQPQFLSEVLKLGSQTGASLGIVVGAPVTFALLRRAPLSRIAVDSVVATTYGGLVGFALSLAFAQPRPTVGFMLTGGCVGFGIAAARLWAEFRHARRAALIS